MINRVVDRTSHKSKPTHHMVDRGVNRGSGGAGLITGGLGLILMFFGVLGSILIFF